MLTSKELANPKPLDTQRFKPSQPSEHGCLTKNRPIGIVFRVILGIMENKTEATIMGLYRVQGLGFIGTQLIAIRSLTGSMITIRWRRCC